MKSFAFVALIAAGLYAQGVDYLVVTPSSLAPAFAGFARWKTRKGLWTEVVPAESVSAHFPGRDNAEKLRNCIKLYRDSLGTGWVLLAGDVALVPTRMAATPGNLTELSPCDLYFSDLDRDWDADGDGIFGEETDSVEMVGDVYVGRAPVLTESQVAAMVAKWLEFEHGPEPGYMRKLLQAGDTSSLGQPASWFVGYITSPCIRSAFRDSLDAGFQLVWHVGHSDGNLLLVGPDTALDTIDVLNLAAEHRTSVFLTVGSLVGAFDRGCIGSCLVRKPNAGSVAVLANSRAGWVGRSEPLSRAFFSSLFSDTVIEVGRNLALAKDQFVPLARTDRLWRQSLYVWNLLGEPNLPCWTDTAKTLEVNHSVVLDTGPQQFRITLVSGGWPVRGFVCLWKGDSSEDLGMTTTQGTEVYERRWIQGSGTIPIHPRTPGEMLVTATSLNHRPYEGSCGIATGIAGCLDSKPHGLSLVRGGDGIWVTSGESSVLSVYDAAGRAEHRSVRIPANTLTRLAVRPGVKLVRLSLTGGVLASKVVVVR